MEFKTLIGAASLQRLLAAPRESSSPVVLDCRFDLTAPGAGGQAYLAGHIPTALYVDLNRDLSAPISAASGRHPLPAPQWMAARFEQLGVRENSQVIVYDEVNGSFAARAWWLLRWLGHSKAAVLDGGMKAWRAAGGPVESGGTIRPADSVPSGPARSGSAARVDPHAVVSSAELVDLLRVTLRLQPELSLLIFRLPTSTAPPQQPHKQ